MADFNVRSDSVNVEQIMEQIRSRIRDKRGVDYTEDQIRELATVKLETFLDPRGVRSDLLEQFRRSQPSPPPLTVPLYPFEDTTLFDSHRGFVRFFRRLFRPLLMLFFNSNALAHSLHAQTVINRQTVDRLEALEASVRQRGDLYYELLHNLVIELTRTTIEAKNVKMRVESIASRLEFNERRARALENLVVYRPAEEEREARAAASAPPRGSGGGAPRESQRQPQRPQPSAISSPAISSPGASGPSAGSGSQTSPGGQASPGGETSPGTQTSGSPAAPASPAPPGPMPQPAGPTAPGTAAEGPGQRSRRRRRRRGRRGGASAVEVMTAGRAAHTAEAPPAHGGDAVATRVESPGSQTEPAAPGAVVEPAQGGRAERQADARTRLEPPEPLGPSHEPAEPRDRPAEQRDKPAEPPAAPSSSPTPPSDQATDRRADDGQ
jgi:hypothetical protein